MSQGYQPKVSGSMDLPRGLQSAIVPPDGTPFRMANVDLTPECEERIRRAVFDSIVPYMDIQSQRIEALAANLEVLLRHVVTTEAKAVNEAFPKMETNGVMQVDGREIAVTITSVETGETDPVPFVRTGLDEAAKRVSPFMTMPTRE